MGGSPTPISFGELYTALQQGVVDGAENNPPSLLPLKATSRSRGYLRAQRAHLRAGRARGRDADRGTRSRPQEQAWLQEAADASARTSRSFCGSEATLDALGEVEVAGVEVVRLSAAERGRFEQAVAPMLVEAEADPAVGPLLRQIRAVRAETPAPGAPASAPIGTPSRPSPPDERFPSRRPPGLPRRPLPRRPLPRRPLPRRTAARRPTRRRRASRAALDTCARLGRAPR